MDTPKITDGEFNIMNTLWENGPLPATDIVRILNRDIGWNRNTTYTFINRLVNKQVVRRDEPGFICTPLYSRDIIVSNETRSLLNKMFGGSLRSMVASFLEADASAKEIAEVKQMIADWEKKAGNRSESKKAGGRSAKKKEGNKSAEKKERGKSAEKKAGSKSAEKKAEGKRGHRDE